MGFTLGVPSEGAWREVLNTDSPAYGGSGVLNAGELKASAEPLDGQPASMTVTLPPLGAAYFKPGAAAEV